jgi:glucose/arabinose dehydrogenase
MKPNSKTKTGLTSLLVLSIAFNGFQFLRSDNPQQVRQAIRSTIAWVDAKANPQETPKIEGLNLKLDKRGNFTRSSALRLIPLLQKHSASGELLELPKAIEFMESISRKNRECSSDLGLSSNLYEVKLSKLNRQNAILFVNGLPEIQSLQTTLISTGFGCKVLQKSTWRLSSESFYYSTSRKLNIPVSNMPARFVAYKNSLVILDRFTNVYVDNRNGGVKRNDKIGQILNLSADDTNYNGGVKSVAIEGQTIAFTVAISNESCPRLELYTGNVYEILKGEMKSVRLQWAPKQCFINRDTTNLNASGGRILFLNNEEILFSMGNAEIWTGSELSSPRRDLGVILRINLRNQNITRVSSGHRNPQGLCTLNGDIFSSEQGPDGGDEINKILEGKNYGWPYETYGWPYNKETYNRQYTFGSHSKYEQPIFAWIPSIAAGDLKCIKHRINDGQTELWLATLRDKSLRRLLITSVGNVVIDERIPVGYRVRDIAIKETSNVYTLLTDDGVIIEFIRATYKEAK